MKIGITCHATAGGSGILATELGIALAERGHTVHFVTYEPPFRLTEFHDNIVVHSVDIMAYPLFHSPPSSLALANKVFEVAEEFEIELWHAHYAVPNAICAIIARDMLPVDKRFRLVTTLHGTDITLVGSDPSFFRLTKYAMETSCAVTAVSHWLAEETMREFELGRPVETIYNFLDFDKFVPIKTARRALAEPGETIVMHISNFRPVKRVTDVVRAFKRIVDQIPAKLIMVGDGPERMSAVGVAKQLGIADKIKYLGRQESIERLIPCADLLFQPSEHESFGLAPLEAMACEVPVLATDSGGVREVISHGETGFLCEVGNIEQMAGFAMEVLTDPERAKAMGKAARAHVIRHFGRDQIVDQYLALYERLLGMRAEECEQGARDVVA